MTATHANTTRAAKARASAGSNDGDARAGVAAEKATSSTLSGALLRSIPQALPGWLATLEGPRKFAINALVIAASALSFTVGVTATFKQVNVVETIGVPKDLEGRIFDRFARGGGESGHGLGLAIARAYAQAHGGDLIYDARPSGARFELLIPQERNGLSKPA